MSVGHGQTQAKILDGIDYLAILSKERLMSAQEALGEGDFDTAFDRTSEALNHLKPLAFSQNHLARFADGHRVIRVEDLQEGMLLVNLGVVDSIEQVEQPGHDGNCYNITFEGEGREPAHVHDGLELIIQVD